jgi:hypothetical protein
MVMEVEMLAMFDGHNEQEVYAAQRACGIFHAAVPEPENFVLGICSVEEMGVCRSALSPAHEKVITYFSLYSVYIQCEGFLLN